MIEEPQTIEIHITCRKADGMKYLRTTITHQGCRVAIESPEKHGWTPRAYRTILKATAYVVSRRIHDETGQPEKLNLADRFYYFRCWLWLRWISLKLRFMKEEEFFD